MVPGFDVDRQFHFAKGGGRDWTNRCQLDPRKMFLVACSQQLKKIADGRGTGERDHVRATLTAQQGAQLWRRVFGKNGFVGFDDIYTRSRLAERFWTKPRPKTNSLAEETACSKRSLSFVKF